MTGVSNHIELKTAVTLAQVQHEIEAALARRSQVHTVNIAVLVEGNKVTLSGTVNNLFERYAAREAAWAAPGVMRVEDTLTVAH